ncbi:MAG: hypothetical protein ACR2MK_06690 [Solirubrobacteraceae bacterium]
MGVGRLARIITSAAALAAAGCGSAGHDGRVHRALTDAGIPGPLVREARPVGRGARFQAPPTGPVIGSCRRALGPRHGVHVEVFASDCVVIVPAGIGARAPLARSEGRISRARCFGALVTLEPTGVVLVRPGARLTLADLFRSWGRPVSERRLDSFGARAGERVAVFVDGRRWRGQPGSVPLVSHSEAVLEVGPYVPPHSSYTFPPGT